MRYWKKASMVLLVAGGVSIVGSDQPYNVIHAEKLDKDAWCEVGEFQTGELISPVEVGSRTVDLEWKDVPKVLGYGVFVGEEKVKDVSGTKIQLGGLKSSTVYEGVKVVPFYEDRKGSPLIVSAFETLPSSDFTAYVESKGAYSLSLGWKKGENDKVVVSRNGEKIYEGLEDSFTINDLRSDTKYTTYVWVENSQGDKSEALAIQGETLNLADNYENTKKQDLRSIGIVGKRQVDVTKEMLDASVEGEYIELSFANKDIEDIHEFSVNIDKRSLEYMKDGLSDKELVIQTPVTSYTLPVSVLKDDQLDRLELKMSREKAKDFSEKIPVLSDEWDFHLNTYHEGKRYVVPYFDKYVKYGINVPQEGNKVVVEVQSDGSVKPIPYKVKEDWVSISSPRSGTYVVIDYDKEFTDLEGITASERIDDFGDRLVIRGYSDGEFKAHLPAKKHHIHQLFGKSLGMDKRSINLGPVGEELWYGEEFSSINDRMSDELGLFGKGESDLSREETAYYVNQLLKTFGYEGKDGSEELFLDENEVSGEYLGAVRNMKSLDIMVGNGEGRFSPKESISREQLVMVMDRALKELELR